MLLWGTGTAWADPPARAGRIAEVAGTAWLFDPDTKGWARVQRNQTIGQGDQLRTDTRSRVALRVGSSTVWLDEQSDLEVLQMDDAGLALRLLAGDVALRLRTTQAAQETRVQTREGVISPEVSGLFRVDQLDRGSRLAVLQGRAQFDSDPGAPVQRAWLREGEQAEFWWAESPRIERQPVARDKFSAWFTGRDQAEAGFSMGDQPYVSPEMTGAEDLNQHGSWESAVEYGNVWIPTRVAYGWEPYRDGNWVWTRQWGWSWVDNAPWGFAPFHYGRWVQYRGRWAWAPGRFEPRPAYAPALVAWSGGPTVSIGITIGGVRRPPQTGWVPLAPRQNFVPIYPHSPQYLERFNWGRDIPGRIANDHHVPIDRNPKPVQYPVPVPSYGNGQAGNPNMPWNRDSGQRNPQPVVVPVQSAVPVPVQVVPNQPLSTAPQVQRPQPVMQRDNRDDRDGREYGNNRNPRDYRDSHEDRDSQRPQRYREPVQPAPAMQQPVQTFNSGGFQPRPMPQPAAQPQPQPQVQPQVQRPQPQLPPQAQAQFQPQPQPQPQARPVDDDKPNGKRNKRENQERPDRDLR